MTMSEASSNSAAKLGESCFRVCTVHGVRINVSSIPQSLEELDWLLHSGRCHYVCFMEGNILSQSLGSEKIRGVLNRGTLVYPDGIAVAKEVEMHTGHPAPRVSGPTFLLRACDFGRVHGWRHYILGGAEGVVEQLVKNLESNFPGLQVAGFYTPPFRPMTEEEEAALKQRIEATHPDLLWVGLGGPKQEFWMDAHLGRIAVPVMLGVGAAFNFHAGARPWAPAWIRKIGMEWLFRALTGGGATFKRNLQCVSRVFLLLAADGCRFRLLKRKKIKICKDDPAMRGYSHEFSGVSEARRPGGL